MKLRDSEFRLAKGVPIATRLSICTPTIQFKMALYIDEAVSPAVVKILEIRSLEFLFLFFYKVAMKNRYRGSEQPNRYAVV